MRRVEPAMGVEPAGKMRKKPWVPALFTVMVILWFPAGDQGVEGVMSPTKGSAPSSVVLSNSLGRVLSKINAPG